MIESFKYYHKRFGIGGVMSAIKGKLTNSNVLITVNRKDIRFPFSVRFRTSDIYVFDQVFLNQEYNFMRLFIKLQLYEQRRSSGVRFKPGQLFELVSLR